MVIATVVLTAGEIIPVVSGKPWEVYVCDSLVEPLGMSHTQTLGYNMSQMPDAARPLQQRILRQPGITAI